jgi:hypothetical protein
MDVQKEAYRLAWELREEFRAGGEFTQADFCAALAGRLGHLAPGGFDVVVGKVAVDVERAACRVVDPRLIAERPDGRPDRPPRDVGVGPGPADEREVAYRLGWELFAEFGAGGEFNMDDFRDVLAARLRPVATDGRGHLVAACHAIFVAAIADDVDREALEIVDTLDTANGVERPGGPGFNPNGVERTGPDGFNLNGEFDLGHGRRIVQGQALLHQCERSLELHGRYAQALRADCDRLDEWAERLRERDRWDAGSN